MRSNSILVYSERMPASLELQGAFGTGHDEIMCLATERLARDVIEARAVDLVAVDVDGGVPSGVLDAAAAARVPVVSVSGRPDVAVYLLRERRLANLIACPGGHPQSLDVDIADLVATKQKLIGGDVFGLEPYVRSDRVRYAVDDLATSHFMAICIRDDLRARGQSQQRAARIALLAHQVTTAVLERQPGAGGSIEIEVAADARTLAVAARFGGLDGDGLEALVRSCLDDDMRPATADDLGLPSVLSSCRTVVINAAPGEMTELIGLVPSDATEQWRGTTSFHLSITEPLAPRVRPGTPRPSLRPKERRRCERRTCARAGLACSTFGMPSGPSPRPRPRRER
jgi:hypothetical protein